MSSSRVDAKKRAACLKAMREAPLRPTMSWDELRKVTRES